MHDLSRLLSLLEEDREPIPVSLDDADELTTFAIVTRYPGAGEPVSAEEYQRAVDISETVVEWAEGRVDEQRNRTTT